MIQEIINHKEVINSAYMAIGIIAGIISIYYSHNSIKVQDYLDSICLLMVIMAFFVVSVVLWPVFLFAWIIYLIKRFK